MYSIKSVGFKECVGCGACKDVCKLGAISFFPKNGGFTYPELDVDKCVKCGKCLAVCPTHSCYKNSIKVCHTYYSEDDKVLNTSSSGGLAYAIGSYFIRVGGIVYGVKYSADFRSIKYTRIDNINGLQSISGSKYAEAENIDMNLILNDLKNGKKVCYFGLPCQVAAVYNYTEGFHSNLLLVSLICLGKSSQGFYKKYISEMENSYSSSVKSINMRSKENNWMNSYMSISFCNGKKYCKPLSADNYGIISHKVFRESCYHCTFKINNSAADLIIGDFWGVEFVNQEKINPYGTSCSICLTEKGLNTIKEIEGRVYEVEYDKVIKTNGAIVNSTKKCSDYDRYIQLFEEGKEIEEICNSLEGKVSKALLSLKYRLKSALPFWIITLILRIKNRNK